MESESPLNRRMLLNVRTIVSFITAFAILAFLIRNIDIKGVISISKNLDISMYILASLVFYSSFLVRGIRWRKLLSNLKIGIGTYTATEILFLSWFANCIVPAKIGDIYRSYLLKMRTDSPMTFSVGTILVERIFDLAILIVLLSVSGMMLFTDRMPVQIYRSIEIGLLLLGIFLLGLVAFSLFKGHIFKSVPDKYRSTFQNLYGGVYGSCPNKATFADASLLTLLVWVLEIGRFLLVTRALGIELNIIMIVFVALAASFLSAIPLTPAGLGAVEVSIVGILAFAGIDTSVSTTIALLDRLISYWSILFFGAILHVISDKT